MKLQEKLAYFEEQVTAQSQAERQEALDQYEATLQNDLKQYEQQVDANFEKRLLTEKEAARKATNKELSRIQISQQHELYVHEEAMKNALFQQFEANIQAYKQTPAYLDQLKAMLKTIQDFAGDEIYDIYLDKSDAELKDQLEAISHHPVTFSDRDFLGGLRGVLRERQILMDFSFSTLYDRLKENFIVKEVN